MNSIDLLKAFAKEQGISLKEVDRFLEQFNKADSIKDLLKMPKDTLNHIHYISYISEPLRGFIEESEYSRYETISLQDVAEKLLESMEYFEDELNKGNISKENYEEEIKPFKEIEKQILNEKFGSVVNDW